MMWFQGTVAEAISEARSRQAVFVVYIYGSDEQSVSMNDTFTSSEVCSKLQNGNYVTIKIESNSETCQQFSQLYPVILIPSTYFIGKNGVPLEILGGCISADDLLAKINTIDEKLLSTEVRHEQRTPEIREIKKPEKKTQEHPRRREEAKVATEEQRKVEDKTTTEAPTAQVVEPKKPAKPKETTPPKVAKVPKKEEQTVASKIRVQDTLEGAKAQEPKKQPPRQESNVTRLQLRLPDGSSLTQQFSADDTLERVRQYLLENANPRLSNFRLLTPFPRREYEQDDYSQSLRSLQLTPCAVVLVTPVQNSMSSPSSGFTSMLWTLLGPLITMFNYIRESLFGRSTKRDDRPNQSRHSDVNASRTERSESGTGYRTGRPATAFKRKTDTKGSRSSSFTQKDGNFHRMNNQDDDDDNNTWNGNSTQQM